jgi:Domain of unknown function (DUF4129)
MSVNTFEKTNWNWQIQQLQQRIGEWWELQLSRNQPRLPNPPNIFWPDWLGELLWLLVRVASWLLLGFVLVWLALQLLRVLEPYLYSLGFQLRNAANRQTTAPTKELTAEGWFKRSQAYYRQGNYGEAYRALYMAMLQRLNDTGIAPHEPSRTDGEYLNITQQLPQNRAYQTLLKTHERLCFGNTEISPEAFEQCQQAYRDIER